MPHSKTDPRIKEMKLYARVGEDELGSGVVGLKQGIVPAGCIPLVACEKSKVAEDYIVQQMQVQGIFAGKKISLVRFAFEAVEIEVGQLNEIPA